MNTKTKNPSRISRRTVLKASSAVMAASILPSPARIFAAGSDKIRVGLIGCGGRGTGAGIIDCAATPGVELVAMGDIFQDHLDAAPAKIKKNLARKKLPVDDIYKVTPDKMFAGFDAYKKVIAADVDMIILTTPPYFRPQHLRAAIAAGKHVFVEKPIAVDPAGVRDFIETGSRAKEKGLTIVAGTQMRRARHIMAFMDKVHNGALGSIDAAQCVRRGSGMLTWRDSEAARRSEWSDIEYQLRRWLFATWLSGDFVVEQHVHNLDLVNWAMQSPPESCVAMGGRQVRTGPEYGNVYDHMSAELTYPGDVRVQYLGSQIDATSTRNDMRFTGTEGKGLLNFGNASIEGKNPFKYEGQRVNPQHQEYADMIAAIRKNEPINEATQIAESTLTAIMIRMSAYTGRALKFDWCMKASQLDLGPAKLKFTDYDLPAPAMPGITKLI